MKLITKRLSYKKLLDRHVKILRSLQYKSGLFAASSKSVSTGYDKSWLRDNFYECLAFEVLDDYETVKKTYDALLQIFLKHEYKIDHAIARKPQHKHEYIHARFHPETFDEFWEDWGNMQNDSIGAILFKVGELEKHKKGFILQNESYFRIVNKLVRYLESLRFWEDRDNGVWEENEEVHLSSVGACVAGLKAVSRIKGIEVPKYMIDEGMNTIKRLFPRESDGKFVDLAELSLIYPYDILTKKQAKEVISNVEYLLLRKKGVIRYKNDYYYNKNPDGYSEEAEWCFGLAWLAIIYEKYGNKKKAKEYIEMLIETDTSRGIPELYFSNTDKPNTNTPLGWAESLYIVALHDYNKMRSKVVEKSREKL